MQGRFTLLPLCFYSCPFCGAQIKRPEGKNVPRQNVPRQNVRRHKVPRKKGSKRQNVPRTKCPKGQNVPRKKKLYTSISNFAKTVFVLNFLNGPHTNKLLLFWAGLGKPFLYTGHIGLGKGPLMYIVLYTMSGNEVNLWIGLFLLWGG